MEQARKEINWLNYAIISLDKVGIFSRWTNILGISTMFLMVCFTFVGVFSRYVFNAPIKGTLEITEVMMVVAVFLAIAHTQNEKAHVAVDLISAKLTPKPRLILEFINNLLGMGVFIILIWQSIVKLVYYIQKNVLHGGSSGLSIPEAPFEFVVILGCSALCLLLLRDLFKMIADVQKNHFAWYHWFLMFGIPILLLLASIFWMQPKLIQLSLPLVGLMGVITSLVFMLMGMPIAFALILTSLLFIGHIRGFDTALGIIGQDLYRTVGSYGWSVLPFFVMMGYFCFHSKFGEDLFYAAYKWFGHFKGGMAIATIIACTFFAAIVGDNISATATMGSVSIPQMKRYGYDNRLTVGSIVGGASLGPIIPPSVPFIMYGLLASVSIGDLFIAGIGPGLIMAICFVLIVIFWCRVQPDSGPAGPLETWKERTISLKAGGPVLILFVVVIGGIYTGIFSPTEGGAIGAIVTFLLGLFMRRWNWSRFSQSLLDTGKVVSMVFLIIVGGMMFSKFVAWCNLTGAITTLITSYGLSGPIYVALIVLLLLIAGCFIDAMPMMLIGVPIFHPIAVSLGVDPLWFALLVVMSINVGAVTPPVGISLFVLKGLNKEIPMHTIYTGAIPFAGGTLLAMVIIFLAPAVVSWLPSVLK